MYSIRSAESWGVGDYGDLKLLLSDAATKSHADFMLINPIHATAPVPPLEPSPYLPESRRFLNVTYIRPQDIAEYAELNEADQAEVARLHAEASPANDSIEPLDINSAWWHKRQALQLVYNVPRSVERQAAFDAFKEAAGPDLRAFAAWSVAFQVWGAPWEARGSRTRTAIRLKWWSSCASTPIWSISNAAAVDRRRAGDSRAERRP